MELAKSPKWTVRQEVAENLQTPTGVLVVLSKDKHPLVRESVAISRKKLASR